MVFDEQSFLSLGSALTSYSYLISFIAPLLGGEVSVMTLAFLSARGYFHIWLVIFFGFWGMLLLDAFWFSVARTKYANKLKYETKISKQYVKIENKIEELAGGRDFLILLLAKAIVGTRIIMLIYMGGRKISLPRFMIYNAAPTFIWTNILVMAGWLAGRGYTLLLDRFKNIQLGITFLLIFFGAIYFVSKKLNEKVLETGE